jgi:membrane fusion protein, heavy metal efflux system
MVALLAGALACSADGGPRKEGADEKSAPAEDALCEEHGVLEAVCTKCNPALVAVFKAKGDWCDEHGFPESFCPICHPERGGRPAADVSSDGAPADGTKIRFKRKDTAELAGIETVKAVLGKSTTEIPATVRITYDATKVAEINARARGVVRSLAVDVGSKVKKGDKLLVIDSPEVGANRARLESTQAAVEAAREDYERKQKLVNENLVARKELVTAKKDLAAARAEHRAVAAELSVMGVGGGGAGSYTLTAPLGGVVTERTATIGKLVESEQILLRVVDTSSVWAELDVAETALAKVSAGQAVTITFGSLPERSFEGRIDYLAPEIDPHTRTAHARVPLLNTDGALRAEMFGDAHIAASAERPSVLVPASAIQRAKKVELAFVKLAEGEYETRRVTVGEREGDLVEVVKGLRPGEEVVTTGSFLLKTETLKESIGAGCCETD